MTEVAIRRPSGVVISASTVYPASSPATTPASEHLRVPTAIPLTRSADPTECPRGRRRHRADPPPRAYGKPIAALALAGATVATGGTGVPGAAEGASAATRTGQLTAVSAGDTPATTAMTTMTTTGRHAAVPTSDVEAALEPDVVEVTLRVPPVTTDVPSAVTTASPDATSPGPTSSGPTSSGVDAILPPTPTDEGATTTGGWSAWQSLARTAPAVAVATRTASGAHVMSTQVVDAVTASASTLRLGSTGRRVLAWQQSLNGWRTAHGRSALAVDATFGPITRAATIDFQQATGLVPDGEVGPATSGAAAAGSATPSPAPAATPAAAPAPAAAGTGTAGAQVASVSKKYVGVPYRYGGTSPSGFDCAGFTQYVFGKVGVTLPRTSQAQAGAGASVASSQASVGDLVVFWRGSSAYHVGIYLGAGQMIAAPKTGDHVKVESVYSSNVTYRRVI